MNFNNVYCSSNCHDFYLLYRDGVYMLYLEDILLEEIKEPLNPMDLYKNKYNELLVPFNEYLYNQNKYGTFKIIFDEIKSTLVEFDDNKALIMEIVRELIKTICYAFIEIPTNKNNCDCFKQMLKKNKAWKW